MAREPNPRDGGGVNFHAEQLIRAVLTDRPIAYHPILARAVKSVTGGVFLSQLLYWTPRSRDPNGWIRKTQEDMTAETALSRREQETAREACKKAGVLEWKLRGLPAQLNYRVDLSKLAHLLTELPPTEFPDDDADSHDHPPGPVGPAGRGLVHPEAHHMSTPSKRDRRKAPTKFGGKRQTGLHDRAKQERPDPPNSDGGSAQTITETRSEITTENIVVGALRDRGISAPVAERLATYPADYVLAKCEILDWLVESKSRAVGKNPAGYLRRAIEEDYAPPPHYRSRAEREAAAAEHAAAQAAEAARLQELAAEELRARELDLAEVKRRYPPQPIPGAGLTTTAAWEQTLARLQQVLSGPNFEMFLKPTLLLRCDGEEATIGARTAFDVEQLATRLDRYITPALSEVASRPLRCIYVSLAAVLDDGPALAEIAPDQHAPGRATPPPVDTGDTA
jgi:DnaA-like protein